MLLKSLIFNKKLTDIILIENWPGDKNQLKDLEELIEINKKNPEWEKLDTEEGFPLYPE